jgi:hypothetical protein
MYRSIEKWASLEKLIILVAGLKPFKAQTPLHGTFLYVTQTPLPYNF